jgi:exodeoxyribonuclease III
MKLVSWNVNGLRSAEGPFLAFVAEHQPDVLMLQEVRAFPEQLSIFVQAIPGYSVVFHPADKAGYSGTAIYYKDSASLDSATRLKENSILDAEGRTLIAHVGNTCIINSYTPNGSNGEDRLSFKLSFYEELTRFIQQLRTNGIDVILGGDLNVAHTEKDLYDPRSNTNHSGFLQSERAWIDDLLQNGFYDSFRLFQEEAGHYSWWHMRDPKRMANRGWRLDYFLISEGLRDKVKGASILKEVYGSDHAPILLEVEM